MADEQTCTADNVWNGVPKMYIGAMGETDLANMFELGATQGGITMTTTMETKEVKIDGLLGAIRSVPTSQGMSIATSIVELTLENFQRFLNQAASSLSADKKTLKLSNAQENYYVLALVVDNPQANNGVGIRRTFWFWKAQPDGNVENGYTDDNEATLGVTFKLHQDCTKPIDEKWGMIIDEDINPVTP